MAITLTKIALLYILGGIMAVTGLVILCVPTYIRLWKLGKDWDNYVDKAFELYEQDYGRSKLVSKFNNMPTKEFFIFVGLLWPVLGPIIGIAFARILDEMYRLALEES